MWGSPSIHPNLSLTSRAAIAWQLAYLLHALHAQSETAPRIHRDLKPANVHLYQNKQGLWEVYLLDFGASLVVPKNIYTFSHNTLIDTDSCAGTPGFRAPETEYKTVAGMTMSQACIKSDVYSSYYLYAQLFPAGTELFATIDKELAAPIASLVQLFILRMHRTAIAARPNSEEILQFFTTLQTIVLHCQSLQRNNTFYQETRLQQQLAANLWTHLQGYLTILMALANPAYQQLQDITTLELGELLLVLATEPTLTTEANKIRNLLIAKITTQLSTIDQTQFVLLNSSLRRLLTLLEQTGPYSLEITALLSTLPTIEKLSTTRLAEIEKKLDSSLGTSSCVTTFSLLFDLRIQAQSPAVRPSADEIVDFFSALSYLAQVEMPPPAAACSLIETINNHEKLQWVTSQFNILTNIASVTPDSVNSYDYHALHAHLSLLTRLPNNSPAKAQSLILLKQRTIEALQQERSSTSHCSPRGFFTPTIPPITLTTFLIDVLKVDDYDAIEWPVNERLKHALEQRLELHALITLLRNCAEKPMPAMAMQPN